MTEHANVRLAREQYARQDWDLLWAMLLIGDESYTDLDRLKLSAIKWYAAASGGLDVQSARSSYTCSCCQKYLRTFAGDCEGCPIRAHTGEKYCEATPYPAYCVKPTLANALKEAKFLAKLVKQHESNQS